MIGATVDLSKLTFQDGERFALRADFSHRKLYSERSTDFNMNRGKCFGSHCCFKESSDSVKFMEILSSLAFSDLLVGIIAEPLFLAHQFTKESFLNSLMVLIVYPICGVSLWTLTAISVDRFLALHFHMRYSTLVITTRVKISIAFIWLYNFVSSALYYLVPFIYFFIMTLTTVICILTFFLAYLGIYFIVRHHQLQIHAQQQTVESKDVAGNVNGISVARLKKSAMNTFVFFIFFVICYLPMYALLTFAISKRAQWTTEYDFSITVVFLNSAINPFLFCWRLQELRRNVLKTLRKTF